MEITWLQTSQWSRYSLPVPQLKAAMDGLVGLRYVGNYITYSYSGKRTFTLERTGVKGIVYTEEIAGNSYTLTISFDPARELDEFIRTDEIGRVDGVLQIGFFGRKNYNSPGDTVKVAGLNLFTGPWSLDSAKLQLKEDGNPPLPTYAARLSFPGFLKTEDTAASALHGLCDKLYLPQRASDGTFALNGESTGSSARIELMNVFEGEFNAAAEKKITALYAAVKDIALKQGIIVNAPLSDGLTLAEYEKKGLEEMIIKSQPQAGYSVGVQVEITATLPHYHQGQTAVPLTKLSVRGANKPTPRELEAERLYSPETGIQIRTLKLQRVAVAVPTPLSCPVTKAKE